MKLLYCGHCRDIFNLKLKKYQECQCGKSAGFYTDNLYAVYSGDQAICLGFSNPSFHSAILYRESEQNNLRNFDAWVMPPKPAHITKVENAKEYYERLKGKK